MPRRTRARATAGPLYAVTAARSTSGFNAIMPLTEINCIERALYWLIRYPLGTEPGPFGTFMQGFRPSRCNRGAAGYERNPCYMGGYRGITPVATSPKTPGSASHK